METPATLSSSGRPDSETHTWATNRTYRFTGGVAVFLLDIAENVIAGTPLRKYRVAGT
jgi:hypothetical protein